MSSLFSKTFYVPPINTKTASPYNFMRVTVVLCTIYQLNVYVKVAGILLSFYEVRP
jgi:hypothetical protein